jgi:hypothetical protein
MDFKILGIEHVGLAQHKENSELSLFLENILNLNKKTEIVEQQKVLTEIFDTGNFCSIQNLRTLSSNL